MEIAAFLRVVNRNPQQAYFFHFTDTRNLPSIREHGLLSLRELGARGIPIPAPGGNPLSQEIDVSRGLDAYVHLSFTASHPMDYRAKMDGRIERSKYLQIDPAVAEIEGVVATLDVSNGRGVEPLPLRSALDGLDLEVLYTRMNWADPEVKKRLNAARRCELLIPGSVPREFIRNLDG